MSMSAHWVLLDVLPADDRQQLLAHARRRRFARNEVIFHEGDPGNALHLVGKGHVALRVHTPLGEVATVRVVGPGEFFGELAIVAPAPRNATAVALDATETLVLDNRQFDALRAEHPQVDRLLIDALASEVRRLASQLVDAMYVPVDKRVWRRIIELTAIFGSDERPADTIPLTQDVVAQLSGCTRPSANRVLRGGEQRGAIRVGRGRIDVIDHDAICRLAR
jgi:CRP/FNR family cyclic AMP-dependent transcriptional regulator